MNKVVVFSVFVNMTIFQVLSKFNKIKKKLNHKCSTYSFIRQINNYARVPGTVNVLETSNPA